MRHLPSGKMAPDGSDVSAETVPSNVSIDIHYQEATTASLHIYDTF